VNTGDVFKANILTGTRFWEEGFAQVIGKYKEIHHKKIALISGYKTTPTCFG
jgi:hypothetical protein